MSKKLKSSGDKFVGGFLPPRIINYLKLYRIANDVSQTKVLEDSLNGWMEKKQRSGQTITALEQQVTEKIQNEWRVRKTEIKNYTTDKTEITNGFDSLIREIKIGLSQMGIAAETIANILKEVKQ